MTPRIALLASGSGSNAENIYRYSEKTECFEVPLLLSNNPTAGVLDRMKPHDLQIAVVPNKDFAHSPQVVLDLLGQHKISHIVLAGFLRKLHPSIIAAYDNKIYNIHPSLLPKYGGKGMYGRHVHEAVLQNNESESGITIHLVNEEYDKGKHLLQARCPIDPNETVPSLQEKIHSLEHYYYPRVLDYCIAHTVKSKPK